MLDFRGLLGRRPRQRDRRDRSGQTFFRIPLCSRLPSPIWFPKKQGAILISSINGDAPHFCEAAAAYSAVATGPFANGLDYSIGKAIPKSSNIHRSTRSPSVRDRTDDMNGIFLLSEEAYFSVVLPRRTLRHPEETAADLVFDLAVHPYMTTSPGFDGDVYKEDHYSNTCN